MRRKLNTCIIMATMTGGQHEYGSEDQWKYQGEYWHDEQAEEAYPVEEDYQDPQYDQDQDQDDEREYQRNAGMVLLRKPKPDEKRERSFRSPRTDTRNKDQLIERHYRKPFNGRRICNSQ
jgi:hypothetical protein